MGLKMLFTPTRRTAAAALSLTGAMVVGLVMIGSTAGAATPAAAAASTTPTLLATGATYTFSQQPTKNMSDLGFAMVSGSQEAMFVKFDTASGIAAGQTVKAATLKVKIRSIATTKPGVQVRPVTAAWNPATLTYNNRPLRSDTILNTPSVPTAAGTTLSIPLTDLSTISKAGPTSFELSYSSAAPWPEHLHRRRRRSAAGPDLVRRAGSRPRCPGRPDGQPGDGRATDHQRGAPDQRGTDQQHRPPTSAAPTSTPAATSAAPTSAPAATAAVDFSQPLAFGLPARSTHQKLVFAHYFPPYPISLDNKAPDADYYAVNYLKPSGENGTFANIGGLLRDRPIGRAPLAGDWKLADAKTEIAQAKAAGIDGWTVDILGLTGANWDRVVRVVDAADADGGFKIMLNLDMNSGAGTADPSVIAANIVSLAKRPSIYRIGTADFVLGAFKAENKTPTWWKALMTDITAQTGLKVNFIPTVLNVTANLANFAPISYGIGNWGVRNPANILAGPNYAAQAHALGLKWMSPIAIQDERPNQKMYDEAANTETLRASWQRAISDQADLVQLVTWNDYSEGTSFAPSAGHGYSFLDISAYWESQFQTGSAPTVVRDAVYVTHRIQKFATVPTFTQLLMTLTNASATKVARDTVEVLTFLTAPATVTVNVGTKTYTYTAPAGISYQLYPLEIGHVKASAVRGTASDRGRRLPLHRGRDAVHAGPGVLRGQQPPGQPVMGGSR